MTNCKINGMIDCTGTCPTAFDYVLTEGTSEEPFYCGYGAQQKACLNSAMSLMAISSNHTDEGLHTFTIRARLQGYSNPIARKDFTIEFVNACVPP